MKCFETSEIFVKSRDFEIRMPFLGAPQYTVQLVLVSSDHPRHLYNHSACSVIVVFCKSPLHAFLTLMFTDITWFTASPQPWPYKFCLCVHSPILAVTQLLMHMCIYG